MRKRLLGLLLICCLFVSLVPAAYGAESRYYGFTDVKRGDWFAEPVAWAVENNITTGTSAATFSPNETCSRAQIITFLWRTAGSPRPRLIWAFRDVKVSSYYYTAALWADENGLVGGETFDGNTPCTRSDVVIYLWKLGGQASAPATHYSDVPDSAPYAQAVSWAVDCGITNGTGENRFSPDRTCTRAQIVTFLYRAVHVMALGTDQPATVQPVQDQPALLANGEEITEENVRAILYGMKSEYPEGMRWTNENNYFSKPYNVNTGGCTAFAFLCSDRVFGELPSEAHGDFTRVKAGDILNVEHGMHWVVVLEKRGDSVVVTEGNYNSSIHWGRQISRTTLENEMFIAITRYPA